MAIKGPSYQITFLFSLWQWCYTSSTTIIPFAASKKQKRYLKALCFACLKQWLVRICLINLFSLYSTWLRSGSSVSYLYCFREPGYILNLTKNMHFAQSHKIIQKIRDPLVKIFLQKMFYQSCLSLKSVIS